MSSKAPVLFLENFGVFSLFGIAIFVVSAVSINSVYEEEAKNFDALGAQTHFLYQDAPLWYGESFRAERQVHPRHPKPRLCEESVHLRVSAVPRIRCPCSTQMSPIRQSPYIARPVVCSRSSPSCTILSRRRTFPFTSTSISTLALIEPRLLLVDTRRTYGRLWAFSTVADATSICFTSLRFIGVNSVQSIYHVVFVYVGSPSSATCKGDFMAVKASLPCPFRPPSTLCGSSTITIGFVALMRSIGFLTTGLLAVLIQVIHAFLVDCAHGPRP